MEGRKLGLSFCLHRAQCSAGLERSEVAAQAAPDALVRRAEGGWLGHGGIALGHRRMAVSAIPTAFVAAFHHVLDGFLGHPRLQGLGQPGVVAQPQRPAGQGYRGRFPQPDV